MKLTMKQHLTHYNSEVRIDQLALKPGDQQDCTAPLFHIGVLRLSGCTCLQRLSDRGQFAHLFFKYALYVCFIISKQCIKSSPTSQWPRGQLEIVESAITSSQVSECEGSSLEESEIAGFSTSIHHV